MAPAVVGIAAVQVNVFVNTIFASSEHGAVSWLNYAFRFLQLPIGVFGVAIGTVSTTRYAEAAADDDSAAMSSHLAEALEAIFLLCVPATVGLVLLDRPIIRLVYQHGHFGADDTAAVAAALDCFAIGLVAYAAVKVLAPAFYAAQRTRVAVYASIAAVVVNVGLNAALHARYGYRVLALDTAIGAVVNVAILYIGCARAIAPLPHLRLAKRLARILASSAVMGVAVYFAREWLEGRRWLEVIVPVLLGGAIYAALEARSLAVFRKT
jgi:putative peptidoglycan lipid II flippase